MYSSLIDAPVNTDLILLEIVEPHLAEWLKHLGLFVGSHITRHDSEIQYNPVRVRGAKGDVIIPAGLGIRVFVHLDSGERKPLVEMQRKESGHIETMSCGHGCVTSLARMGLVQDEEITFVRSLPHMDYVTMISRKEHTRLTEGEAARIWGICAGDTEEMQFYFARQQVPFTVKEIVGGQKSQLHLKTHGVHVGSVLILNAIEPARELHRPGEQQIIISSHGGLRLYLAPRQAGKIVVKSRETAEPQAPGQ